MLQFWSDRLTPGELAVTLAETLAVTYFMGFPVALASNPVVSATLILEVTRRNHQCKFEDLPKRKWKHGLDTMNNNKVARYNEPSAPVSVGWRFTSPSGLLFHS